MDIPMRQIKPATPRFIDIVLFVTINLLVDILYSVLDPRVRLGGSDP